MNMKLYTSQFIPPLHPVSIALNAPIAVERLGHIRVKKGFCEMIKPRYFWLLKRNWLINILDRGNRLHFRYIMTLFQVTPLCIWWCGSIYATLRKAVQALYCQYSLNPIWLLIVVRNRAPSLVQTDLFEISAYLFKIFVNIHFVLISKKKNLHHHESASRMGLLVWNKSLAKNNYSFPFLNIRFFGTRWSTCVVKLAVEMANFDVFSGFR